jgi:hypothetical protein
MPRFLLIALIALQAIAGVTVGKTHPPRHFTTGRQIMTTRAFRNGNDSTVIREYTKVGLEFPPNPKYAVLEYTNVESDYELPEGNLSRSDSCVFPLLFGMPDTVVEVKINGKMFSAACALWQVNDDLEIMSALELARKNDYHATGYAVTNWDSALISVQLFSYYEGPYPSDLPLYFNFNAATGNLLTLDSIIAPGQMPRFRKMLRAKVKRILKNYVSDIADQLRKGDIDSSSYDYCMGAVRGGCMENFDPRMFIVSPDTVTVIIDCEFMHALQALEPENNIAFTREELKGILRKEYE